MGRKKQKAAPIEVTVNFVGSSTLQDAVVRAIYRENKRTTLFTYLAESETMDYNQNRVCGSLALDED